MHHWKLSIRDLNWMSSFHLGKKFVISLADTEVWKLKACAIQEIIAPLCVGSVTWGNRLAKLSRQKTGVSTLANKNTPNRDVEKITIGEKIEYATLSICPTVSLQLLTLTVSELYCHSLQAKARIQKASGRLPKMNICRLTASFSLFELLILDGLSDSWKIGSVRLPGRRSPEPPCFERQILSTFWSVWLPIEPRRGRSTLWPGLASS